MAGHTGDAGLCRRVVFRIVIRLSELCAEQGNLVMAGGTKISCLYRAVALQHYLACFLHAEPVGRVVEGTEAVHALCMSLRNVRVAFCTGFIRHQVFRRDGGTALQDCQRGRKLHCFSRAAVVLKNRVGEQHDSGECRGGK